MLTLGFDIAIAHGEKFAKLYVDSWRGTLNGQLTEINFNSKDLNNSSISADSKFFQIYSRIIDLKTATLFSSSCKAAAFWADASEDLSNVLANYGREVGFAYQLADDLVDLENGEMIDSVIVPLLNRIDNTTMKIGTLKQWEIKRKFAKNKEKIKEFYIEEIKRHVDNAVELSKSELIPASSYKDMLIDAPNYVINKMLKDINVSI